MTAQEIVMRLAPYRVGIAGCGGLGSNCAVALARIGLGHLTLVDFDVVDQSNLNRQYYFRSQINVPKVVALRDNIALIDPAVDIRIHQERITEANVLRLFSDCDVIVEAFDGADQKLMLIETVLSLLPRMPLVTGSGMAGWGKSNEIRCEKHHLLYVCGDQYSEISDALPPLAPRVGIVANMQANTVLEILLCGKSSS
jgi:sulfur carrier protein ThiS adenylyltransferase